MPELGTYGTAYQAFTPGNIFPKIRDMLSYDWMDVVSQFSQKFTREVFATVTIAANGTYNFDYSSIGEDYFPPIVKCYWSRTGGIWSENIATYNYSSGYKPYLIVTDIGLATCNIINQSGTSLSIYAIAYI